MSNIDVIGNLINKKVNKKVNKKTINMKKIFKDYKSSKIKKVLENPYATIDPKNYNKQHKKQLIFGKLR